VPVHWSTQKLPMALSSTAARSGSSSGRRKDTYSHNRVRSGAHYTSAASAVESATIQSAGSGEIRVAHSASGGETGTNTHTRGPTQEQ
jgi:hypothetical protein